MPTIDITNHKFGRWTVLHRAGSVRRDSAWKVRCECGFERVISGGELRRGKSKSCGCYAREQSSKRAKTHGHTANGKVSGEWKSWMSMLDRCRNPNHPQYANYGARGISVCDRWADSFDNFLFDMGPRPPKTSIGRKNNNGNYEPDNCRWESVEQQQNNRRNNVLITHNGTTKTAVQWSRQLGVPYCRIISRISRGWSGDQALTAPPLQ